MVDFKETKLNNDLYYTVKKCDSYGGCSKLFSKTEANMKKFVLEGRPVTVISPEHLLSKEEKEEYRKFFCKKAQEDQMNYIYFEDSVEVIESDPMENTMFNF